MIQSKSPSNAFSLLVVVAKAYSTVSYCIAAERGDPCAMDHHDGGVNLGDGAESADRRPWFEITGRTQVRSGVPIPPRLRSQSAGLGGR